MVDVLPYGSWPSPLSAHWASHASPRLEGAAFVGDEIWWGESIADEGGRTAVRRRTAGGDIDTLLPAPWNARSAVHEYGGGSWAAGPGGLLWFVEKTDQQIWELPLGTPGARPRLLTAPGGPDTDIRYGGLTVQHGALLAVEERHESAGAAGSVVRRAIVRIDPGASADRVVTELVSGSRFLAQPALSPDGTRLAWVAWDHPDMPWDRTQLRVGRLDAEGVRAWTSITSGETAALQPVWTDDHELLYLDDPTGRWNIWRAVLPGTPSDPVASAAPATPVAPADADTGGALWVLGLRWYAPLSTGGIVAVRTNGDDELVHIASDGAVTSWDVPPTARLNVEDADGTRVLVSGAAVGGAGIWLVDAAGGTEQVAGGQVAGAHGDTEDDGIGPQWYPRGRAVTFPGRHGEVHAYDYPPTNPGVAGPEGEAPPYIVFVHGGPTSHVGNVADSKTAFFTSRGIGVLDVNYGGSTGYGRAYRERLTGQWGVIDVDDVAAAAAGLAAAGSADARRIAIEGGSAGGWTVLAALATTEVFGAGISRYGVADARALAADTHDFESRYLDGLIGPLPEAEQVYLERSPLSHVDGFTVPVLLLQGADDAVVPPAQSEAIRDALRANGVPHAYVLYPGEGHGFRRAETIVHSLQSELAFLGQVFGFATPDVPPLPLH